MADMFARMFGFSKPHAQPESKPHDFGPPDEFGPVASEELKRGHFKKGDNNTTSYKNLLKSTIVNGESYYDSRKDDSINPPLLQLQNVLEEINTKNNRYDIVNGIETVSKERLNYFVDHIDGEHMKPNNILKLNGCLTIALFCDYYTYINRLSYDYDAENFWAFPLTRCLLEYCDFVDIESDHRELIKEMFKQNHEFIIPSKYISPSTKTYNEYDVYKKQKSTEIYDKSNQLRLDYEKRRLTMEESVEEEQVQNALEQTKLSHIFDTYNESRKIRETQIEKTAKRNAAWENVSEQLKGNSQINEKIRDQAAESRAQAAATKLKKNLKAEMDGEKAPHRGGRAGKKTRMNKRHSFRNKNGTRRRARK